MSTTEHQRISTSPVSNLRQFFRRRSSIVSNADIQADVPKSPKGSSFPVNVSLTSVRSTSPTPERQHSALSILSRGLRRRVYSELESDNNSSDTDSSAPRTPEPEPGRELHAHVADGGDALSVRVDSPTLSKSPAHDFSSSPVSPTTSIPVLLEPVTPTPGPDAPKRAQVSAAVQPGTLLAEFVNCHNELEAIKSGTLPVFVSGHHLTLPAVVAAARYAHIERSHSDASSASSNGVSIVLDESTEAHARVAASRAVLDHKLGQNKSIYGVSTGFGGSADTRTDDHDALGSALLQHQVAGVLSLPKQLIGDSSSSSRPKEVTHEASAAPLPLSDPLMSTSMPESWVRGAMLIRANSLVRGHSAVSWELVERMVRLLREDVVPVVPLRGSISASGDLSPLSYVAGVITGNPAIHAYCGSRDDTAHRQILPSNKVLANHSIEPLVLRPKEHLGILNGTAFSCSVGILALHESIQLAVLTQVCTALGVEAMLGCAGSFSRFVSDVARPHPGQVEVAATVRELLEGSKLAQPEEGGEGGENEEVTIEEDKGKLRQDRYALRTAPQFIGPQVEDLMSAMKALGVECNSTTDNPLVEAETGTVHHGGNFQAMAISNAMEKTRLALHHFGKILFAQCTELINPAMNRGLPPNLAATDPSLNFFAKAIDIACAAYVSELGFLANPVTTHIQSAEMHNQAVNSLALISARATITAIEVLSMLVASYLHALCQALDLRAMQAEFDESVDEIVREEVRSHFGRFFAAGDAAEVQGKVQKLCKEVASAVHESIEDTSTMDNEQRMEKAARATTSCVVEFFLASSFLSSSDDSTETDASNAAALTVLPAFRSALASRLAKKQQSLRVKYLTGGAGLTPASRLLGRTKGLYEFIRVELGIRMHGRENLEGFDGGIGKEERAVGGDISVIYDAIRSGRMQSVLVKLFEEKA